MVKRRREAGSKAAALTAGETEPRRTDAAGLTEFLHQIRRQHPDIRPVDIAFVCIGTDRSSGDCLGPVTGTLLKQRGYARVIGTLDDPCDADTLRDKLAALAGCALSIAIDACLGAEASVGSFLVGDRPLAPGQSVRCDLPSAGDYSIAAVVNRSGYKNYWSLQTASLALVLRMSDEIVQSVSRAFPIDEPAAPYHPGSGGLALLADLAR